MKSKDIMPTFDAADTDGGGASEPHDLTVPLGTSDFTGEMSLDPLSSSSGGKTFKGGILLIAGVVLVAGAGLLSMRKIAKLTAAHAVDSADATLIENFLVSFKDPKSATATEGFGANDEKLLEVIKGAYAEHQVPWRDVKKDPFDMPFDATVKDGATGAIGPASDPQAALEEERTQVRDRMQKGAEQFRLNAIMGGSNPLAIVGESIVKVGQTLSTESGDLVYTVKAITRSTVELVVTDEKLEVTVEVTLHLQR